MVEIIDERFWSDPSWGDHPPAYNTEIIQGVKVTGLVIDDGTLFNSPGVSRLGYEVDDLYFDIFTESGSIVNEVYPYGDDSDTYRVPIHVFDGNGNHLGTYESNTCGSEYGCTLVVDIDYSFDFPELNESDEVKESKDYSDGDSGTPSSTGELSLSYGDSGPDVTFDTDQLLIAYGTGTSPPDGWPEALETDDWSSDVTRELESEYCPSDTATISVDIENTKFIDDLTGTATIRELSSGDTEEVDIDISPTDVQTVEADITVPQLDPEGASFGFDVSIDSVEVVRDGEVEETYEPGSPSREVDIVDVSFKGDTLYEGSADIIDVGDDISIESVNLPDQVTTGNTVRDNSITVSNTGQCEADIVAMFDGESIGEETISSEEELQFEFDYTAADVSVAEEFIHNVTVEVSEVTVAGSREPVEVLGLPDVLNITDVNIDGQYVSGRTVEFDVTVENQGSDSYDVDILLNDSDVGSSTVRSGSSSDISFEYDLPDVEGSESVSVEVNAVSDDVTVDTETEAVTVSEEYEFVELTDLRLPSEATSEETIGSRDATAVVESEIDDVYVEISYDGTMVGSSSITRSGKEEIGIELDMPKVEERSTETIEVSALVSDAVADTISEDIVVTGPASLVSIDFIDAPSEMLSEDTAEVTADIVNDGDDDVTVNLEYNDEVVAREDIRGGRSEEFVFEFEAPAVEGSEDVSIDLTALVDDVVADESSTDIQVDNILNFVDIDEVSTPDSIYGGETVDIDAVITNGYEESLEVELEYDGSIVGSTNVRSENDSTITFEYSASDVSETNEDKIELLAILDGDVADKVTETLTIDVATLDIEDTDFPESVCVGNDMEVSVTVSNPTNVSRDALISLVSDEFDTYEQDIDDISAGRSNSGSIDFTVPADVSVDSETFEIVVERNADSYVEVDSTDFSVTINKPDASIENIDVPSEASPGEVSGSIEVSNSSECDVEAEILVSDNSDSVRIRSGDTEAVDVTFDLGTEERTFDIEVLDEATGDTQDESSLTITPVNYLEVDTEGDDVYILTTYDDMEIEGQVVGQNPAVTEDIQSEFDVLPNLAGASFSGELESSDSEFRMINTDDLRFLNVGVDKDMTWVIGGDVEDTSRSFRYSTSGIDGYIPDEELRPRRARTDVKGGLLSGIGIIRHRLGLK